MWPNVLVLLLLRVRPLAEGLNELHQRGRVLVLLAAGIVVVFVAAVAVVVLLLLLLLRLLLLSAPLAHVLH